MQKQAKRAKEFRKEREETANPDIWLLSPTIPKRLAMRQFIKRATDDKTRGIQDLLNQVKATRKGIEAIYKGSPNIKEPGYKYYRNSDALIEFIEEEYLNEVQRDNGKESENNISEDLKRLIHSIALRKSKHNNSHSYQEIADALSLYHNPKLELNGEQVAEKIGVRPNVFSTWKTDLDDKIKELN